MRGVKLSLCPESAHDRAGAVVAPVAPLAVDRAAAASLARLTLRVGAGAPEAVQAVPRPSIQFALAFSGYNPTRTLIST